MTYLVNQNSIFQDALIFVELRQSGRKSIWTAWSENDAIEKITAAANRSDTSDYDMTTFDGCVEWNAHDLRDHSVIRFSDISEYLDNAEVMEHAEFLEWVCKTEETEETEE